MKHVLESESRAEAVVRSAVRKLVRPELGKHGAFEGAGAAESRSRMIRARLNAAVLRRWVSRGNTVARFGGAS